MIPWLEPDDPFPPTDQAAGPQTPYAGLLAAGADLSAARLRMAYSRGIFPWYSEGQPILWWTTTPRMVLPTGDFKLSRSLRKTLRRLRQNPGFAVTIDQAFDEVIQACALSPRQGQSGTWIGEPMIQAYRRWHQVGDVHSFETWMDGQLVGGLYGVCLGKMFFGESMFARRTDASKIALAALVCFCRRSGIRVIDCQQQTEHLASLGAHPWPRQRFESHLDQVVALNPPPSWAYHESMWDELGVPVDTLPRESPASTPTSEPLQPPEPDHPQGWGSSR